MLLVHDNATRILGSCGDGLAPIVHASCAATLRDIIAGTELDAESSPLTYGLKMLRAPKPISQNFAFLFGRTTTIPPPRDEYTTRSLPEHTRRSFTGTRGRGGSPSTLCRRGPPTPHRGVPCPTPSPTMNCRTLWNQCFAHGSQSAPVVCATPPGQRNNDGGLSLHDFHPVIQAHIMGVLFTETRVWSSAWKEEALPTPPQLQQIPPLHPTLTGYLPRPSPSRPMFITTPRGDYCGHTCGQTRGNGEYSTPPATIQWSSYGDVSPPSTSSWATPPRGAHSKGKGGNMRGKSRWSPERPMQVHWGMGTDLTRPYASIDSRRQGTTIGVTPSSYRRRTTTAGTPPALSATQDAITLLQKLTSFMASETMSSWQQRPQRYARTR